eukprot:2235493-Amphidinium_carterae.1
MVEGGLGYGGGGLKKVFLHSSKDVLAKYKAGEEVDLVDADHEWSIDSVITYMQNKHRFVTLNDVDMFTDERSKTESYRPFLKGLLSQDEEVKLSVAIDLDDSPVPTKRATSSMDQPDSELTFTQELEPRIGPPKLHSN